MAKQIVGAPPARRTSRAAKMTGAQVLVETLRRERVEVLFGHPGGASLPIYDALYDAGDIRHVLV
ncbi:MAG: thiamine pyrophosphate-binding protein, partial [Candidatus Methylomirabilaceae bacterium]